MRVRLESLDLDFQKSRERIEFADFHYFFGKMGAGKSTIARLIDFCLGASLQDVDMTPALQSEFISCELTLIVEDKTAHLMREHGSGQIRATWEIEGEQNQCLIPARKSSGEVVPGTGIEVISDLIYVLAGKTPPKVRRSKLDDDSDLGRLSLRDLLWYCYLDQDSIDSDFFNLDRNADRFKRLKSRDVLRFIIGFHQERVSELEIELETHRNERVKCEAGANALRSALSETELASDADIEKTRQAIEHEMGEINKGIKDRRNQLAHLRTHEADILRERSLLLAQKEHSLQRSIDEIDSMMNGDQRHRNELISLSVKFRRTSSAREVLKGVHFSACPACDQSLPQRESDSCHLCGQSLGKNKSDDQGFDDKAAEADVADRIRELEALLSRHERALERQRRLLAEVRQERAVVDAELNRASEAYDSAYLSDALRLEKRRAALVQQRLDLERVVQISRKISALLERVDELVAKEKALRRQLKEAREQAEKDTKNLDRLRELFLDCLVQSKLPGFYDDDLVTIKSPDFVPEVTSLEDGDLAVTSFANLGSGGKKTLFKCCFAIAVHRLSSEVKSLLPQFLIIDTPMKNISERENIKQFDGFFDMLFQLSQGELADTQIIVIDKEVHGPPEGYEREFKLRHMQPNERGISPDENPHPPLIRYYTGK